MSSRQFLSLTMGLGSTLAVLLIVTSLATSPAFAQERREPRNQPRSRFDRDYAPGFSRGFDRRFGGASFQRDFGRQMQDFGRFRNVPGYPYSRRIPSRGYPYGLSRELLPYRRYDFRLPYGYRPWNDPYRRQPALYGDDYDGRRYNEGYSRGLRGGADPLDMDEYSGEGLVRRDYDYAGGFANGGTESRRGERSATDAAMEAERNAWQLLIDGEHGQALQRFGELAREHPRVGAPKIGYALAAADMGHYDQCSWALRRAFRYNPYSVERMVPLGEELRPIVNDGIQRYRSELDEKPEPRAEFTLAALHYLQGDRQAVRQALDGASQADRQLIAARNLQRMLTEGQQPRRMRRPTELRRPSREPPSLPSN